MLIHEKEVSPYIAGVRKLLKHYKARILNPIDLAFVDGGCKEIALENLSS